MAFTETLLPIELSQGSSGGAGYNTTVRMTKSGFETRNKNWSQSRSRFNVTAGLRDPADYELLRNHHMAMAGSLHGFLFKDPGDYKSCSLESTPSALDQSLGDGDGTETDFQLVKLYESGTLSETKTIYKPKANSVLVAIEGEAVTGGWSVDTTTGIISFDDITKSVLTASDNGDSTTRIQTTSNHGLSTGDSVWFTTFTGDWAALNATRYIVTVVDADEFDIDEDSSGFTAYSSNAGQLDTLPQTGETITAGFEYYLPVRFDTDLMQSTYENYLTYGTEVEVVEIRL